MTSALALCDTHCHIHDDDYPLAAEEVLSGASVAGVSRLVIMGSDVTSSRQAIKYAQQYSGCHDVAIRAGVGLYPHEVPAEGLIADTISELCDLIKEGAELVAGVGEIGLDALRTQKRQRPNAWQSQSCVWPLSRYGLLGNHAEFSNCKGCFAFLY